MSNNQKSNDNRGLAHDHMPPLLRNQQHTPKPATPPKPTPSKGK